MIPRIIHQTWKSQDLPPPYDAYRASVEAHHPDWQIRLWTDEDNRAFIESEHAWFLDTYDGYKHHIERVDAVRYFILLTHGGVYIDLDMECRGPIDPLLEGADIFFGTLAGPTLDHQIVGNAFMAAPPGHPFFAYLTKRLPHVIENDVTHTDVFHNTGPNMLARHVHLLEHLFRIRVIGLEHICDACVLSELETSALTLVHHGTNAWNIQHPAPEAIEGYVLYRGHDIQGFDIDYVEYGPGDYASIARACSARADAIGFNYNGYIKGRGGVVEPCARTGWTKPGIEPWVCVKEEVP